jgi:hypothetical protein
MKKQHRHQPTDRERLHSVLSKSLRAWLIGLEYDRSQHPDTPKAPIVEPEILKLVRNVYGFDRRPRNGKIARLPEALRNQINQMLEDGLPYKAVLATLRDAAAAPLPYAISEMNLSNWRRGGYHEWLQKRQNAELLASLNPVNPSSSANTSESIRTKSNQSEPPKD